MTGIEDEARQAIIEADEYMTEHRVTESWRVISRLHRTLVRLTDHAASRQREGAPSIEDVRRIVRDEFRYRMRTSAAHGRAGRTITDEDIESATKRVVALYAPAPDTTTVREPDVVLPGFCPPHGERRRFAWFGPREPGCTCETYAPDDRDAEGTTPTNGD